MTYLPLSSASGVSDNAANKNPLHRSGGSAASTFETLFARYEVLIGRDFSGYRNHVYRTITYAMHFLGNAKEHERLVEAAFAHHDIGLWTDQELAYLEPS
jgi:hypothetical protein